MALIITIKVRVPKRANAQSPPPAGPGAGLPAGPPAAAGLPARPPGAAGLPAGPPGAAGLPARPPGAAGMVRALLPLVEPGALILAEAAGMSLIGRIVCATALRSVRQALG